MHHCFNVVTDAEGIAGAVLIRALEPGDGVDSGTHGPGRLARALEINRSHNGLDLTDQADSPLWLERRPGPPVTEIAASPRINVDYAGDWAAQPWRFTIPTSRHLSVRHRLPRVPSMRQGRTTEKAGTAASDESPALPVKAQPRHDKDSREGLGSP